MSQDQDRANAFLKRLVKTIPEGIVGGATSVHTPGIKPVKPKSGLNQGARDRIKTRISEQRTIREADEAAAERGGPLSSSVHSHAGIPHVLREIHYHGPAGSMGPAGSVRRRDTVSTIHTPATKKERLLALENNEARRTWGQLTHRPSEMLRIMQRGRVPIIKPPHGYDHYEHRTMDQE